MKDLEHWTPSLWNRQYRPWQDLRRETACPGIISHVTELKEWIDRQVVIEKGRQREQGESNRVNLLRIQIQEWEKMEADRNGICIFFSIIVDDIGYN